MKPFFWSLQRLNIPISLPNQQESKLVTPKLTPTPTQTPTPTHMPTPTSTPIQVHTSPKTLTWREREEGLRGKGEKGKGRQTEGDVGDKVGWDNARADDIYTTCGWG